MFIYSWNKNSEGASTLAQALGARKIRHENSKFKGSPDKVVINWGSSNLPNEVEKSRVLNSSKSISLCSNKKIFFETCSKNNKISVPPWTTSRDEAFNWVADNKTVCARQVLQGHSAEGLVIMTKNDPKSLVDAPLYTKYIKKQDEYRVHVVKDRVVDVQRKALRSDWYDDNPGSEPNYLVRNLQNGFIYVRGGINPPKCVIDQALLVVDFIGLDFGAVDVIYNKKGDQAYVLEINSAPGLVGTTVENYAKAFKELF